MSSITTEVPLQDLRLFRQANFIDGTWVEATAGNEIKVDDPSTGEVIGCVPKMGAAQTRQAIEAAARAFPEWRSRTAKERAVIIRRWFDLMVANQDDLASLMTLEQGKPLTESRGEVMYAASFLEWFSEEAKRVYGDTIPAHQSDKRIIVIKEPIGVVACITPWNFPLAMITRKAGPALAAGCTVVLKPASQTPFSALALAELADRAGVPKGVFNVITGKASEIGGELASNPAVRKLSFTGSTEIGKLLMSQCSTTVKKLSLELGGNAPLSFSTMPILTPPSRARSHPNTETPVKPVFVRTVSWCRMRFTMRSPKSWPRPYRSSSQPGASSPARRRGH